MAYEELPPVEEAKALLVKPAAAPAADKVPARGWRGHWLQLFGKGSPEDVTACCMAHYVPCVAFGWNHRRGLGLGFWCEAAKFVALWALCYFIVQGIDVALHVRCGPQMPHNGGPSDRPLDGGHSYDYAYNGDFSDGSYRPLDSYEYYAYGTFSAGTSSSEAGDPGPGGMMDGGAGGEFTSNNMMGDPHGDPMDLLDPDCVDAMLLSPGMLAMFALLVVAVAYMTYFTALRRRQLRERFGIPGSFWQDYCLWAWCGLCALAQETRTLMHNHVHEGVWYGEVPGAAHQQYYAAPATQQIPAPGTTLTV